MMRNELNAIDMIGEVVIGEGEMDEAPMLYINENEELQSYLMWFARMEGLPYEFTNGETKVC